MQKQIVWCFWQSFMQWSNVGHFKGQSSLLLFFSRMCGRVLGCHVEMVLCQFFLSFFSVLMAPGCLVPSLPIFPSPLSYTFFIYIPHPTAPWGKCCSGEPVSAWHDNSLAWNRSPIWIDLVSLYFLGMWPGSYRWCGFRRQWAGSEVRIKKEKLNSACFYKHTVSCVRRPNKCTRVSKNNSNGIIKFPNLFSWWMKSPYSVFDHIVGF